MFTLLQALQRSETGESSVYELENALGKVRPSNLVDNTSHKSKIQLPASIVKWHRNVGFLVILDALNNVILIDLISKRIAWNYSITHLLTEDIIPESLRVASTGHVVFSFAGDFNCDYVVLFQGKIFKQLSISHERSAFHQPFCASANYTIMDQLIVGVTRTTGNIYWLIAWDFNGKKVITGEPSTSFGYLLCLNDGKEPYFFSPTKGGLYNKELKKVFDINSINTYGKYSKFSLHQD